MAIRGRHDVAIETRTLRGETLMGGTCPCGGGNWGDSAAAHMIRCRDCGLLAPRHPPDYGELARWYEEEYWKHYREEQVGTGRDNIFRHVLCWLNRRLPERGTVLDVGCGAGRFLSLCQSKGWRAIGVEPSQDAAAHARRRGLEVHSRAWPVLDLADASVDAVTFINVLDHLPNPFGALHEAARVLKPGGLLYIRVVNAPLRAWMRRVLAYAGLEGMAVLHVYGFGRRSLSRLLPRFGFTPLAIRTAPPARGHAYPEQSAALALGYRALRLADRLGHGVSRLLGLDRLGWGPSLEVLARKQPVSTGGSA